jgi:hypothetical protein
VNIGDTMFNDVQFSDQAKAALQLAEQVAREFRHEYIGTEHVLLGLVQQGEGIAATVLRSRGLDQEQVRQRIKEFVQYGPHEVSIAKLPLTPRSQQVIKFACEDIQILGQSSVDTEHLLMGLLHESDGVAGLILRKCGLRVEEIGPEVFKIRMLQMKIVERVVRPLQANIARKRRMRDELLSHLSAIYDEELVRFDDPLSAVEAARERFGDAENLAVELQSTVPRRERWEYQFELLFGWHAPETVTRWMTRVAVQLFALMGAVCAMAALIALREFGWNYNVWLTIRPLVAAALVLPISVATTGICYYKMRDHMFGVFGAGKSRKQVIAWAAVTAGSLVGSGLVFIAVSYASLGTAQSLFIPFLVAGILWAASNLTAVKFFGLQEIRDTTWALLDLKDGPAAVE